MKKAMLFLTAFLFSVSAHAASLTLTGAGAAGATQNVAISNGSTVIGAGIVPTSRIWSSAFNVTSDADTPVNIEWSFNPSTALKSATLAFYDMSNPASAVFFSITKNFAFSAVMLAGVTYGVDILNATSGVLGYDLSVAALSAVPVPAAMFLFAPALIALIGLRRRMTTNATV